MRIYKVKIVLFTLITTLLSGCSISKNLTSNEKILKKNNLYINDILTPKDSLNNLFLQKKNSTFIVYLLVHYYTQQPKIILIVFLIIGYPKRIKLKV